MKLKEIRDWKYEFFMNSSGKKPQFNSFVKDLKREIKKVLSGSDLNLVEFSVSHFYVSGFVKNTSTGKYCYFSTGDVRVNNWYDNFLVRTCRDTKDYSGGFNNYCSFDNFVDKCVTLIYRKGVYCNGKHS